MTIYILQQTSKNPTITTCLNQIQTYLKQFAGLIFSPDQKRIFVSQADLTSLNIISPQIYKQSENEVGDIMTNNRIPFIDYDQTRDVYYLCYQYQTRTGTQAGIIMHSQATNQFTNLHFLQEQDQVFQNTGPSTNRNLNTQLKIQDFKKMKFLLAPFKQWGDIDSFILKNKYLQIIAIKKLISRQRYIKKSQILQ
ncbi:UNKNOWN [Stylonychia lemnae]|uniref:Uncharacterized protein n=1 Tax=Stylonychia lemnae TaxID=5949 RepID=A0A078A315_STYLE|nr:UNKNOWN [Stylonychia lemnae]|eukprot:CDW75883.1 UNKNOWN [Stylonychia lemnae]